MRETCEEVADHPVVVHIHCIEEIFNHVLLGSTLHTMLSSVTEISTSCFLAPKVK